MVYKPPQIQFAALPTLLSLMTGEAGKASIFLRNKTKTTTPFYFFHSTFKYILEYYNGKFYRQYHTHH